MAKGSDLDRVTAIVLREMRGPVFVLIAVYTIGMTGIVLIPGQDADGNPVHMGFFHAFYFMTYTATTTGFGELPHEFSELQRMWAIACLLLSVGTWIYVIGSIARLFGNPFFTQALLQRRFSMAVQGIQDPFVIVCGFGDTGSLLARGLSDHGITGVVIDGDQDRIKALGLRHYSVPMPGLCADASVPKNLIDAGLDRPNCRAVIVLTDEDMGLKIAVMSRLLNPHAMVVCRCPYRLHETELRSLGSIVIADPFEAYAREMALAIRLPALHALDGWLIGARDASLAAPLECPDGTWIICGYGRLGRWVHATLTERGVRTVVIAPNVADNTALEHKVHGLASHDALIEAGLADAAGLIAATDDDTDNLAILLNARAINPDAFLVVRQNNHENELAFNAARANLIMQPSLVSARRILFYLISPLLQSALARLEADPGALTDSVLPALQNALGDSPPAIWVTRIGDRASPAVDAAPPGTPVTLTDVMRDPRDREQTLHCVPLLIERNGVEYLAATNPELRDSALCDGDRILFCGTTQARTLLTATLTNDYTLEYLVTGVEPARSALTRFVRQRAARHAA